MSRASRLFSAPLARSRNREGYPAWDRPVEEQYVQTLLTNSLGQTYYASQDQLLQEAGEVHRAMLAEDPAFAARALPYARQHGYMRLQPVFGLALLSQVAGPHFEEAFDGVVLIPNDLMDFMSIVRSLRGGEGGRRIKRLAGRWLADNLDEYWAIKYGGDKSSGYSLADLIRTVHPNTGEARPLFDWLLGKEADLSGLPQVAAFERLKRAATDGERVAAIREGRLPHEVVTPFAGGSRAVWEALVPNLPVFALVRHLQALERHGVLDGAREIVEQRLTDPQTILASKMFPFRFLTALERVRTPWVADALRAAADLALENIPEIRGRTAVFVDRSGSMAGNYVWTAALFGIALMRKAGLNGRLLLFDTAVEEFAVSARDTIVSQAERIQAGGGTDTSAPLRQLLHERYRADNLILITDEQQNAGAPFYGVLGEYRRKVNPEVRVYIIDVSPYRNALTPTNDARTWYVYGWSEQVLNFIALSTRGWKTMAEAIRGWATAGRHP